MKIKILVKPKDLGTRHPDLEAYFEKKTITMIELLKILDPYMKNFHMIGEITRNLLKTFREAASELEQVARGEIQPAKVKELKPFISMTTLSYLYRLLTDTILGTNEDSTNLLLIKLFFKSWEPYLSILDKWLKHGTLMDKYSEFFVKYNMDLNMITNFYSKLNWNQDYVFQTYTVKWKALNEVYRGNRIRLTFYRKRLLCAFQVSCQNMPRLLSLLERQSRF